MSYDTITTTSPKWELRLANSKTFEDICILTQARNRQAQLYLNKPGSFVFDLPLEDGQALLVDPIVTCVKAYRNGELKWSGPVWTVTDSAPDNKSQVSCIGWFELLNHRIILDEISATEDAGVLARNLYYSTLDDDPFSTNANFTDGSISNGPTAAGWTTDAGSIWDTYPWGGFPLYLVWLNIVPGSTVYNLSNSSFSGTDLVAGEKYQLYFEYQTIIHSPTTIDAEITLKNISTGEIAATKSYTGVGPTGTSPGTVSIQFEPTSNISAANLKFNIKITVNSPSIAYGDYVWLDNLRISSKLYDIPIHFGVIESTQSRTKTYPKYSNVGQEITSLSEMEAGFDFEIDIEDRSFNIYQQIGESLNLHLGYNVGANNLKSISTTQDGSRMVNSIVAIGSTTASPPAEDEGKQSIYGKFMETVSAPNTTEQIILEAFANEEVALRADPLITYDIAPMPSGADNVPQPFDDYNIGDVIFFSAKKGRIQIDSQAVRIFGMSVSIDDNGVETVSSIQTRADG